MSEEETFKDICDIIMFLGHVSPKTAGFIL